MDFSTCRVSSALAADLRMSHLKGVDFFLCRVNPALGTPGKIHVMTGKKISAEYLKVQFRNFLTELFRQ